MLSNQQMRALLEGDDPIVKNVMVRRFNEGRDSPLQPASLDLHVGEILVPPEQTNGDQQVAKHRRTATPPVQTRHDRYSVPIGGSVVLLTKEEINFPSNYAGLMFPKSSGLAERGVLLTNFGHVDPGYKGTLRYALINLSSESLEIRAGDPVSCLCIFELNPPANPDFSFGRHDEKRREAQDERRTFEFTKHLSPRLLSLTRITEESQRVAEAIVLREGFRALLLNILVALGVGVLSAAITIGLCWIAFVAPRLDGFDARLERLQTQQLVRPTAQSPNLARPKGL